MKTKRVKLTALEQYLRSKHTRLYKLPLADGEQLYGVHLMAGVQSFTACGTNFELEGAEWMRSMLAKALATVIMDSPISQIANQMGCTCTITFSKTKKTK